MFRFKTPICRSIKSNQISSFYKRLITTDKQNGLIWSKESLVSCKQIDLTNNSRPKVEKGIFTFSSRNTVQYQPKRFCENIAPSTTRLHKATNFEKRVLVWNNRYPSVEEVPERVSVSEVTKAKDWFRIRVNIGMIIATVVGSIFFAISGKRAAARGESVAKQSLANAAQLRKEGLEKKEKKSE